MNKKIKVINSISYPHIVFTIFTDEDVKKKKKEKKKLSVLTEHTVTLGKLFKPKMHMERTKNPVTNPKV